MPDYTFYKIAIADFRNFWFLTPNNQNYDFFKINANKIKNEDTHTTAIHVVELRANNRCTKCLANIFIFGGAMAQKPDKGNDVTF